MAVVRIPSLMRALTGGAAVVEAPGRNVREVIDAIDALHPGVRDRLVEEGSLRPDMAVAVDGETVELGLLQPVRPDSELVILPAIGGG